MNLNLAKLVGKTIFNLPAGSLCPGVLLVSQRGVCSHRSEPNWRCSVLPDRAVVRVAGSDSLPFLQGLITNDIHTLTDEPIVSSLYCMFLNTGGRVLFDAIISRNSREGEGGAEEYLLDVDQSLAEKVVKHLKIYKIRRKVSVELVKDLNVLTVFNESLIASEGHNSPSAEGDVEASEPGNPSTPPPLPSPPPPDVAGTMRLLPDPRVALLGYRCLSSQTDIGSGSLDACPPDLYNRLRLSLGVAEGGREIPIGKALPFEYNLDWLQGVNFHKGCYLGQELTARTFHTGVVRKRIVPCRILPSAGGGEVLGEPAVVVNPNGKTVGKLVVGGGGEEESRLGLVVLRLQEGFAADALTCSGATIQVWKPVWWPKGK